MSFLRPSLFIAAIPITGAVAFIYARDQARKSVEARNAVTAVTAIASHAEAPARITAASRDGWKRSPRSDNIAAPSGAALAMRGSAFPVPAAEAASIEHALKGFHSIEPD